MWDRIHELERMFADEVDKRHKALDCLLVGERRKQFNIMSENHGISKHDDMTIDMLEEDELIALSDDMDKVLEGKYHE
jgi:hypothetical protein